MALIPPQSSYPSSEDSEPAAWVEAPLRRRWGWVKWLGVSGLLVLPVGVSIWAFGTLVQLPALPKCFNARHAQPADQIFCAEQLASKQESEDLRRAMLLAHQVSADHPLRKESDRLIQIWSTEILRRGELAFQAGNLQEAVDLAMQIPSNLPTSAMARKQIQEWEAIWSQGEDLYRQAEAHIDNQEWFQVLAVGRQLWQLENDFWATTRYQQLMRSLQTAREENKDKKFTRSNFNRQPETVDEFIAQWEQQQDREDAARLQQAQQLAQAGNVEDLRMAVAAAQQVLYGTARYEQAQTAIAQWRQQIETIEDRPYLDRAQQLASEGNLQAAINEASNVGWGRALYGDARDRMADWRDRIYAQQLQQQTLDLERMTQTPVLPASGLGSSVSPQSFPPATGVLPVTPTDRLPLPPANPIVIPVSDEPSAN